VHVDAFAISLREILTQPRESDIDHPIAFARRNLSYLEKKYNTTEREGLAMVYDL
jgi:hypothetical protein